MNLRLAVGIAVITFGTCVRAQAPATGPAAAPATAPATAPASGHFKSDQERMGYALGLQLGERLKGIDLDLGAFTAGIKDAQTGAKPLMTDQEIDATMTALQKLAVARAKAEADAMAARNQKAGEEFLAANGKNEGVKTTASGLQYKVLTAGKGKSPQATDVVSVNYRGTLINGKEFDASGGKPLEFPVNGVIPGWSEALQLMKEGDKFQLVIPANLAYGVRGAAPDIEPNSVLIFEVELLKVTTPAPAPAMPLPIAPGK
jgi:FKBP-type peptidyl-prolyl cis-trans isomerase FklB